MADIRKILKEHVADVALADGVVHCRGDEPTFDSMEAFGRHVDAPLSRPCHVVWHRNKYLSPSLRLLIGLMKAE